MTHFQSFPKLFSRMTAFSKFSKNSLVKWPQSQDFSKSFFGRMTHFKKFSTFFGQMTPISKFSKIVLWSNEPFLNFLKILWLKEPFQNFQNSLVKWAFFKIFKILWWNDPISKFLKFFGWMTHLKIFKILWWNDSISKFSKFFGWMTHLKIFKILGAQTAHFKVFQNSSSPCGSFSKFLKISRSFPDYGYLWFIF